jgi:hypothetical protein
MAVAVADGKTELAIEFGSGVEIAHRMRYMVKTVRQIRHSCLLAL